MPQYLLYEQGNEEGKSKSRRRGRRGGREEEGKGRETGVIEVYVSVCPTQSMQHDLDAQPPIP